MPASDTERLAIAIEANTRQFESAMKRVERTTNQAFRGGATNVVRLNTGINQATVSAGRLQVALTRTGLAARGLASVSNLGRGLGSGLLGTLGVGAVLSLGGAIAKARDALAGFDAIAKTVRTTGLSAEFYQSLTFAATETGISQDKLNAALLVFAKNSGLAANGTGALAAGLKRSNPELLKAIQLAETQDERLRLVAEAMRQASNAAQRAALASIAFGGRNVVLTEIFAGGAAALEDFMRRAQELGLIIDRSLLDRADELDDKLSVLSRVIDMNLNVALAELAPVLVGVAQALASISGDVRSLIDKWRQLTDALKQTPEGAEMLERFIGLATDLDLGTERMRRFHEETEATAESAADIAKEMQDAAAALSDAIRNSPEMRRLVSDEQLAQLAKIQILLAQETPEAARAAGEALQRLAHENPRFQPLADQIQILVDKLLEAVAGAVDLGEALGTLPTTLPSVSASDLARESGGRTSRFLQGFTSEALKSDFDKEVDRLTDLILKAAQDHAEATGEAAIVITRAAARAQAQVILGLQETAKGVQGAIGDFVDEVVHHESGGDAAATTDRSSATGLGQFIKETWIALFKQEFPDRAKNMSEAAILALRTDAEISRKLIEAYARENAAVLQAAGISVDKAALHLAHFLGPGDAVKVLQAASGTPLQGLISSKSIKANPEVLGGGATVDDAIAYANARAQIVTTLRDEKTAHDELVASIEREIEALGLQARAFGQSTFEAEKARVVFDLQQQAIAKGLELTPELIAEIDKLAAAYANATVAVETAAKGQDKFGISQQAAMDRMDAFRSAAKDVLGGFISDLVHGKSAADALASALEGILNKLIDIALNSLFEGGGLGGLFGGGGVKAGLFHQGGIAGQAFSHRRVSAAAFLGAQRYHSGGLAGFRPGEVPAILRVGERIIPAGSRSGGPIQVVVRPEIINNVPNTSVEVSDGRGQPRFTINPIAEAIGGSRSARGKMGLPSQLKRRA